MRKNPDQDPEFVTALARGLDVIQAFSRDTPELTLSEVAARTGLKPATARRSLITLSTLGYVRQHGRRYVLTARVLQLGAAFVESMNLNEVAQNYLQEVVDVFHDASSLSILDGNNIVYLVHIPSNRPARLRQYVGARMPAHAASMGYILLSGLDDTAFEAYLAQAPFPAYTPRTPTSAQEIRELIEHARRDGYAIAQDAIAFGALALSVPVHDKEGRVVAAINCSADATRVDRETMIRERFPALQNAAKRISHELTRFPALTLSTQPEPLPRHGL